MLKWTWIPETALVVGHALAIAVIVAEDIRFWQLPSSFQRTAETSAFPKQFTGLART